MKNYYNWSLDKFINETLTTSEAARLYNYIFNIDIYNARTELTDCELYELVVDMATYHEEWFDVNNDLMEDRILRIVER